MDFLLSDRSAFVTAPPELGGLERLPHPRHLFEYVTGSQHYHLGCFEDEGDTLAQALDRLLLRSFRVLPPASRVLDVGCGTGGGVRLLAAGGHRAFGLDPCESSIARARSCAGTRAARFVCASLADFAGQARRTDFDALVLTEVLQHLPRLDEVFRHCRGLLRPGGLMLVQDVFKRPGIPWSMAPFQTREGLRAAAREARFELLEAHDLTRQTAPTLPRLAEALLRRRTEITRVFAATRPRIEAELEELRGHVLALQRAYAEQHLGFEALVLRPG